MEFTKKRKIFILVGMFVLLAITGFLNFTLNNNAAETGDDLNTDQFAIFRAQREEDREMTRIMLENRSAIDSGYSSEERAEYLAQLTAFNAIVQFENTCESIISESYNLDATVTDSSGNVLVVVRAPGNISSGTAAAILSSIRTVRPGLSALKIFISIAD